MIIKEASKRQKLILILCEDKKSFPNYIKTLCEKIRYKNLISKKGGYKIEVKHAKNTDPLGIVNKAKGLVNNYHKIYCVFDYDGNTKGRIESYKQAMKLQTVNNIKKINSVCCYEIWLLLHFEDVRKPHKNCNEIGKEIEKYIKKENIITEFKYNKSDLFNSKSKKNKNKNLKLADMFFERIRMAKTNTKKLAKHNTQTNSYNPSTKIADLIADLEDFVDQ